MLKTLLISFVAASATYAADSPITALDQSLTPLICQYFPDAEIKTTDTSYFAKHGTMEFTLHGRSRGGEIFTQTYKEEGPNYRGFILKINVCNGPYQGAAAVPQRTKDPYWTTFLDAPEVPGQNKYLWICFSFGSRLNKDFETELLGALPNSLRMKIR